MRTAFIIEPTRMDISKLYEKYSVNYIFNDRDAVRGYLANPEQFFDDVLEWAQTHFDPRRDFFVLTGNMGMVAIACLAIQEACGDQRISLLKYDGVHEVYFEVRFGHKNSSAETIR